MTLLVVLPIAPEAAGQVELGGEADLAVVAGGPASAFVRNGISAEFRRPHAEIHQFSLFIFAQPDDAFLVNARLQMDTWGTGELNAPRLTLAAVEWRPENRPWYAAVGRFVSPFGLYPQRQLGIDNSFGAAPLLYGYFVNVSDARGLWPVAGETGTYGTSDVGLTTLYFGGYVTGGLIGHTLVEDRVNVEVAVLNSALASDADYTNRGNLGVAARLGVHPAIFWQQGISVSYGSFMQRRPSNIAYNNLNRFRQLVVATDVVAAYGYVELSGELAYAQWTVPGFAEGDFFTDADARLHTFSLDQLGGYVDLRYDLPFLVGAYTALRVEQLTFGTYADPRQDAETTWDEDVRRVSVAAGYKLARSIVVKVAYSEQFAGDIGTRDAYAFRTMLSVLF